MSRIAATFAALKEARRTALIPYVCAGDPYADATVDIMLAMAEAGADVIELGIPFSDPMAVGSEMCIRDSRKCSRWSAASARRTCARRSC